MGSGGVTDQTYNYVINGIANGGRGSIVLSHMGRYYDVTQASKITSSLLADGINLNTISEGIDPKDKRL